MTPRSREHVVERVLSLLSALHAAPRGLTWPEIIDAVDFYDDSSAGRKAFQRDRAMLEAAGLRFTPGTYSDSGYRYRLAEWDRVPELTPEESAAVRLAALALEESSSAKAALLAAERLTAGSSAAAGSRAPWSPRLPGDSNLLETMSEAIARRSAVGVSYVNARGESSERTVWPWTVHVHGSDWYLIGYDLRRLSPRVFRFSRIRHARHLPAEHSPRSDPFAVSDRAEAVAELIRQIPPAGDEPLRVAVEPGAQAWVRWVGRRVGVRTDGAEEFVLEPEHREALLDQALTEGRGLRLISPESLLADWRGALARIAAAHGGDSQVPADLSPGRTTRRTLAPQDRVYRSFTLLRLLSEESPQRLSALALRLGVNEELLSSDLWALSLSSGPDSHAAPFSVEIDEAGWVSLTSADPAFTLATPPVQDIIPLVAALGHLAQSTDPESELGQAIVSAQVKLLASGQSADLAESLLTVSRLPSAPDEKTRTALEAIASGRLVSFSYLKPDEEPQTRTVLPVQLLTEHGRDYLLAWDVGPSPMGSDADGPPPALKHFRLDRSGDMTPGERAQFPPSANPERGDGPRWGTVRRRRSQETTALLGASASQEQSARELLERFGARNIRESASTGELIGEVNIHTSRFPQEIMAARGSLRILAPARLRAHMLRMAGDMLASSD